MLPTPTATATQWEATGNWYRNVSHESALDAVLKAERINERASIATLDSIATSWANDLSLSLGCIGSDKVMYVFPYSFKVPPSIDTLTVGVWNYKTDAWVEGEPQRYRNPVITDDGASIYIASNAQVRQILGTLNRVDRVRPHWPPGRPPVSAVLLMRSSRRFPAKTMEGSDKGHNLNHPMTLQGKAKARCGMAPQSIV